MSHRVYAFLNSNFLLLIHVSDWLILIYVVRRLMIGESVFLLFKEATITQMN